MSVRVMLVDDHPVVRAGVRAVVEVHPDLTVVAEAADGAEAIGVCAPVAASTIHTDGCARSVITS